jgi:hypothetical protein
LRLSIKLIGIEDIAFGVGDLNAKTPLLAAWKMVCKPKKKGGLGVVKLQPQNDALLLKNLDNVFLKR